MCLQSEPVKTKLILVTPSAISLHDLRAKISIRKFYVDEICTRETERSIVIVTAALNKMKALFSSKLDLNLRKKLVECCNWSSALYGAENWIFRKVGQKYLEILHVVLESGGEDHLGQ
jgi:hypothetical protein